ncbi:hypothetical protein JAAARDRAFT_28535 [Jaapia argillacea MUCL 33604]|uniref:Vacuole protein n=1 Tax=Jaapia argillacea MUCL 33604 TaxID=933084 RepID=A0A067QCT9_9AGAM|nr:hypothetical protein JAAARDRAFT_28535 [Jaapia argillacea MUCL 33604]
MCGGGAAWKREVVLDHKFDFVDVRDFTDNGFGMRMKYLWLYVILLKSFLVYVSDIFTAITMLTTSSWSNQIFNSCQAQQNDCISIPFSIGKWLFVGCIIFSFLLLAYEARKSKKIIASHDISYAFTNIMAQHYYSIRSYDHFCFFDHLSNSTKKKDDFAFWIFFTFKSWKRLLLADGPRQTINALTLYAFYISKQTDARPWYDVEKYFTANSISTSALTATTTFTCIIFIGGLLQLVLAGVMYIPLLCYIQGNLKEYVCHKVDKRIAEIIKRKNKQRLAKAKALAKKEAMGDFSHLKNNQQALPQPTLPNISIEDDDDDSSMRTRGPPPSNYTTQTDYYYQPDYKPEYPSNDYPPMPAYNYQYGQYNQSNPGFADDAKYDDDASSTAHLAMSAAPFAQSNDRPSSLPDPYAANYSQRGYATEAQGSYMPEQQGNYGVPEHQGNYVVPDHQGHYIPEQNGGYPSDSKSGYPADSRNVYQGDAVPRRQPSPAAPAYVPPQEERPSSGLAYDDEPQDYPSPISAGPPPRSLGAHLDDVPQYDLPTYTAYDQRGNGGYSAHGGYDGGGYGHAM